MKVAFFQVGTSGSGAEALDRFLASHRVAHVDRHFVADGPNSFWAFCITWTEGAEPPPEAGTRKGARSSSATDYREVLSVEEFGLYDRLRKLRKQVADADGLPPFAVFTNEQLAAMVLGRVVQAGGLLAIDGVGPSRVERFGAAFLSILAEGVPGLPPAALQDTQGGAHAPA